MLKNPAYSVIMERYGAAPPKPKLLAKSTLQRLSDPVKGRHMDQDVEIVPRRVRVVREAKCHPRKQHKAPSAAASRNRLPPPNDRNRSYDHSPIRKEAWTESSPSKYPRPSDSNPLQKDVGGDTFFITGTNDVGQDYENDEFESPPPSPATLRKNIELKGPEVSPIDLGMDRRSVAESPRQKYSPPDIYSPRTKEALRASFSKEQSLPPPKKTFNPLQFSSKKAEASSRKFSKPSSLKQKKIKQKKPTRGKAKTNTSGNVTNKRRGGRTRGPSLDRQSKIGLRKGVRKNGAENDFIFDGPSERVQLLSNKLQASKLSRVDVGRANKGRNDNTILRSTSLKDIRKGIKPTASRRMGGSKSASTFKKSDTEDQGLPRISATSTMQKPTTLPQLRTKHLLGRKSVSPSLQDRYADILQVSKEAHKYDPPHKSTAKGFGVGAGGRQSSLQPIVEKRKKADRNSKNPKINFKRNVEPTTDPKKDAAEAKEKRRKEEAARRAEQEKRLEARAQAAKKKEEMEFRSKIRKAAEENATKGRALSTYETVDDKLISMFKTHCVKLSSKLSEADKLASEFKVLSEFDGYSSSDRQKMQPLETEVDSSSLSTNCVGNDHVSNTSSDNAFLSKPLIM